MPRIGETHVLVRGTIAGFVLSLGVAACSSPATVQDQGTRQGGAGGTDSGGVSGTGGTAETGGNMATGGTPDTGGTADGGSSASGGLDTGGTDTGGTEAGGSENTGGLTGTGGEAAGGAGDGGSATGGEPTGGAAATGGSGGCSTGTFDPCSTVPHFTGTQVVDGNNDDFCGLPSFEFRLANAKLAKNHDSVIPLADLGGLTVRAVVQVAWSAEGMHLYATVYDSAVHGPPQTVGQLWDGDSIELMVSANQPPSAAVQAGGPPDNDGPYQAIFSGAMGSATALGSYQNQALPPSVQYQSFKTADGYAVEAMIPWVASGDVQSGQTMGFNFGINDAETQDNSRDFYGAYAYVCAGAYAACEEPYNNALTWCQPRAE